MLYCRQANCWGPEFPLLPATENSVNSCVLQSILGKAIFVRVVPGHGTDKGVYIKYMTEVDVVFWCRHRANGAAKGFGVI